MHAHDIYPGSPASVIVIKGPQLVVEKPAYCSSSYTVYIRSYYSRLTVDYSL